MDPLVEEVSHMDPVDPCKDLWVCTDHHMDQVVVDVSQTDLV